MRTTPIATLLDSRLSYENFEGRCPHCGSWNIFNRVSDLRTTAPIAGREATCLNSSCNMPVWLTDDWVNPAFEMFLFESEQLWRKKQYMLTVLTAVQAYEVFLRAVAYTWLLYRPLPNQREFVLFNDLVRRFYKKIHRYPFGRMRDLVLYIVLEDKRPRDLNEAGSAIDDLLKVPKRYPREEIIRRTSGRLRKNLLALYDTRIHEKRNLVVHMHAYRPTQLEAGRVLIGAKKGIYGLMPDLGPDLEFEDYANAPPNKR